MLQSITAVYEHGLLRPLDPLILSEKQIVRIQLEPEKQIDAVEKVFKFLIDMGWVTPPSGQSKVMPISLEERNRIADILGKAIRKPVSRMIIDDRGEG
ncbi:conserved hypothetical protein [Gammaproteobacteria bacterium]